MKFKNRCISGLFLGLVTSGQLALAQNSKPDFIPTVEESAQIELTHLDSSNYTCQLGYIAYGSSGGNITISLQDPKTSKTITLTKNVGVFLPQDRDPGYTDGSFCNKFQQAIQQKLPLKLPLVHKIFASHELNFPKTSCSVRNLEIYELDLNQFADLTFNQNELTFRMNDVSGGQSRKSAPLEDCYYSFSGQYDVEGNIASCKGAFTTSNLYLDQLPQIGLADTNCTFSGPSPTPNPNNAYPDTYSFGVKTSSEAGFVSCSNHELKDVFCAPKGTLFVKKGNFSPAAHTTYGDVTILERTDGFYLKLQSDFMTEQGPDLRVVLRDTNGSLPMAIVAPLKAVKGAQEYKLAISEADLKHFDRVVIYCAKFHVDFGIADLK